MKLRYGFVSNSSSSSFVCDICGEIESGMDACLSDFEMSRCINGHEFHNSCAKIKGLESAYETFEAKKKYVISSIETSKWIKKEDKKQEIEEINAYTEEDNEDELNDEFNDYFSDNGVSEELCPICSFKEIAGDDMTAYLLKKANITKKQVLEEVKTKFDSYSKFMEFIKNK
jgi:hypothetical protein